MGDATIHSPSVLELALKKAKEARALAKATIAAAKQQASSLIEEAQRQLVVATRRIRRTSERESDDTGSHASEVSGGGTSRKPDFAVTGPHASPDSCVSRRV